MNIHSIMQKICYFIFLVSLLTPVALSSHNPVIPLPPGNYKKIKINWVNNIPGNFSFKDSWSYPIGVYHNRHGQLSCDGLCPDRVYRMKDSTGKIPEDSLKTLYTLLDTSHQFHSIESKAWTYEWAGTDFITAQKQKHHNPGKEIDCTKAVRKSPDTFYCYTAMTPGTHSSLKLIITADSVASYIHLNSIIAKITPEGFQNNFYYPCEGGTLTIDKNFWQMGILKAEFDFIFEHPENPQRPMYWKGKIYTKII